MNPDHRALALAVTGAGLALVLAAACASDVTEDPVDEGIWGPTRLVEELRIGVEEGEAEYMFGRVGEIAVASDGSFYVSDRSPLVVRKYDAEGDFQGNVGRQGEGPGEYSRAPGIRVLHDDRLAVWSGSSSTLSIFTPSGVYEGGFRRDGSYYGPGTLKRDVDGNLYFTVFDQTTPRDGPGEYAALAKHTIEGEEVDFLPLPDRDEAAWHFVLSTEGVRPFTVMTMYAWSPLGYLVVGRNDRYDIELRRPEGATTVGRDLPRVAVKAEEHAEWEVFRQYTVRLQRERGMTDAREIDPIPGEKPYFRDIRTGDDGRIWVHRYVEAVKRDDVGPEPDRPERPVLTWREPRTWDVFEPDGTFVGTVVLPDDLAPHVFRGDRIWGTVLDDAGVQRVVRLRVEPATAG